ERTSKEMRLQVLIRKRLSMFTRRARALKTIPRKGEKLWPKMRLDPKPSRLTLKTMRTLDRLSRNSTKLGLRLRTSAWLIIATRRKLHMALQPLANSVRRQRTHGKRLNICLPAVTRSGRTTGLTAMMLKMRPIGTDLRAHTALLIFMNPLTNWMFPRSVPATFRTAWAAQTAEQSLQFMPATA